MTGGRQERGSSKGDRGAAAKPVGLWCKVTPDGAADGGRPCGK